MTTYEYTVAASNEDAEEISGSMSLTSIGLDIGQNEVGVSFPLNVAKDSTIDNAFIRFTSRGNYSDLCQVNFQAQLIYDAPEFTSTTNNITSRTPLTSAYSRTLPAWSSESTYTVDIADVLQEIVNQSDWVSGGNVALIISGSSGRRSGYAYDNDPAKAPFIHVEYSGTTLGRNLSVIDESVIAMAATTSATINREMSVVVDSVVELRASIYTTLNAAMSVTVDSDVAINATAYTVRVPDIVIMDDSVVALTAQIVNSKPFYRKPPRLAAAKGSY